jgi:hypothetical protein
MFVICNKTILQRISYPEIYTDLPTRREALDLANTAILFDISGNIRHFLVRPRSLALVLGESLDRLTAGNGPGCGRSACVAVPFRNIIL